jgi:protein-S-isoprenylcysteine O-methyltransferase Ste14
MSMFFLAGLGMLRVGWLPFWDLSFQILDLGNVIYVPYWILMWIFEKFDYWAQADIAWVFMGVGAFLFTWGVMVWMQSRFGQKGVAKLWIYRISRHPQYLGWIIWTYGLIIYAPLYNDLKKSWGIGSSLPWLFMTMIIIGICMMEEIHMKKKYGKEYDDYRDKAPFLIPIPYILKRIIKFPMSLIIKKKRPEKNGEVAIVITVYTILLMAVSLIWVDFGQAKIFPINESKRQEEVTQLVAEITGETNWRIRDKKFNALAKYDGLAVAPLIDFLQSDDNENQENAARLLGDLGDTSAIMPLYSVLSHPWEDVRVNAIQSIVKLQGMKSLAVLIEGLQYETGTYPRSVIYESIGQLRASEAWDVLVEGSLNDEEWARLSAVKAMAKIDPGNTSAYLIPLLQSENDWILRDAVAVAHQIKDEATLPYLEELLGYDHYEIRFIASETIDAIKATSAFK